jgi:methionyl aminopeptidase
MITMGKRNITMDRDGWTIRTRDGLPAAHFEHQVALTANGTELLSTYEYIEESLNSNK